MEIAGTITGGTVTSTDVGSRGKLIGAVEAIAGAIAGELTGR
jgi:outer membrane lipoprotein SlyB